MLKGILARALYPDDRRNTFGYDDVGNRTEMIDETGRYTTTYTARYNVLAVTNPDDKTITYAYDVVQQRHTMTDPDGGLLTYLCKGYGAIGAIDPWVAQLTSRINAWVVPEWKNGRMEEWKGPPIFSPPRIRGARQLLGGTDPVPLTLAAAMVSRQALAAGFVREEVTQTHRRRACICRSGRTGVAEWRDCRIMGKCELEHACESPRPW